MRERVVKETTDANSIVQRASRGRGAAGGGHDHVQGGLGGAPLELLDDGLDRVSLGQQTVRQCAGPNSKGTARDREALCGQRKTLTLGEGKRTERTASQVGKKHQNFTVLKVTGKKANTDFDM